MAGRLYFGEKKDNYLTRFLCPRCNFVKLKKNLDYEICLHCLHRKDYTIEEKTVMYEQIKSEAIKETKKRKKNGT